MNDLYPVWLIAAIVGLFGMIVGSFAGAQVWRLRARQLVADKAAGEPYSKKELARLRPLTKATARDDRSRCLACGHQLAWYDLLPLISWLSTRGRCRYCRQPIGWFELATEVGVGVFFALSFLLWPFELTSALEWVRLLLWLAAGLPLAILFGYDAKWFLLPDKPMSIFIVLAAAYAAVSLVLAGFSLESLLSLLGAIIAIGGLYGLLHVVSRGTWVGYGDVTLGVGLGLLVLDWRYAIVAVFLANLIGTLIVLPQLLRGTMGRGSQLPFGPLLILGAIIAHFYGQTIIDWYLGFV